MPQVGAKENHIDILEHNRGRDAYALLCAFCGCAQQAESLFVKDDNSLFITPAERIWGGNIVS